MALTSAVTVVLKGTLTAVGDLSTGTDALNKTYADTMATGTAAEQADVSFNDQRTLAATSEELDFAGGLTDRLGNTVTIAKIKTLCIANVNTTSGHTLTLGGGTTNPISTIFGSTTDTEVVGPEAYCLKHNPRDGFAVTAGSADTLKIDAGANTVVYDIIVFGTSS